MFTRFGALNGLRVDTVIITGCTTSGCVRATVFDASSHNFHTILPRECVGDRTEDIQEANLFDMDSKNADVIPLEEVLSYIRNMERV